MTPCGSNPNDGDYVVRVSQELVSPLLVHAVRRPRLGLVSMWQMDLALPTRDGFLHESDELRHMPLTSLRTDSNGS